MIHAFSTNCARCRCRHRRLDQEAARLTRRAEADAFRWDDNASSSRAGDTYSSSPGHDAETSSSLPSSGRKGEEKAASTDDSYSLSEAVDRFPPAPDFYASMPAGGRLPAGTEARRLEAGLGTGVGSGGNGGGEDARAVAWDREQAGTLSREEHAEPGWRRGWRPGMAGSRAALGLWELEAGGLTRDAMGGRNDGGGSPRGNVDTAQEVNVEEVGGGERGRRQDVPCYGV